jgi:hypothetical protein
LVSDEHVIQLAPALKEAQSKAVRLLTKVEPPPPQEPPPLPEPPVPPPPPPGKRIVDEGSQEYGSVSDARQKLGRLGDQVTKGREIKVTLSWRIEEDTTRQ